MQWNTKEKKQVDRTQKLDLEYGFHTVADFLDERFIVLEPGPPEILKELMT